MQLVIMRLIGGSGQGAPAAGSSMMHQVQALYSGTTMLMKKKHAG